MRHTATDSAAGFQREAAPFWLRRFQRQKLKRARNAVRCNNASQPVSIAKPSMMLSYDSLETGTGSSNSLRSASESSVFRVLFLSARKNAYLAGIRHPRSTGEPLSSGFKREFWRFLPFCTFGGGLAGTHRGGKVRRRCDSHS